MSKNNALLGALSVSFWIAAGGAQAKLVRYEIDGKRYSYSTNNRQQTKEARQRIEAAVAASAAKSKAESEVAENPLVRIFGSPAQREAAEAKARAEQAVASQPAADVASTSSVAKSRSASARAAKRAAARQERKAARREARLKAKQAQRARAQRLAARSATTPDVGLRNEAVPPAQPQNVLPAPVIAQPSQAPTSSLAPRERVTGEGGSGSLTDFVNQVRKVRAEDVPTR